MGGLVKSIFGGGGGGGSAPPPAPSSQSISQTTIPAYAQPYVENLLGQSAALTDINQNPYQPYAEQRIAGFTPMQAQAFQNIANQQVAGQIGEGSNLASQAGRTSMQAFGQGQDLAGRSLQYGGIGNLYGGMGAGYGAQGADYGTMGLGYGAQAAGMSGMGFGAGQRYEQMATSPGAQAAFMSPYMQNVVDYQKQQAIRDYDIASQGRNAAAVRAGAFGGSRQAVAEAEANRALMNQLGGIQAAGTQKAFEDAQRQMQFGADLGLRGLGAGYQGLGMGIQGAQAGMQGAGLGIQGAQAGMQGAGVGLQGVQGAVGAGQYGLQGLGQGLQAAGLLGQLGQTQFSQEMAANQAMQQAGALQQAQQQQALDLQYQDFLKQQNYPYQQLAFMSDMLRGLPLSQSAQQIYTAPPSTLSQLGGLGMTGLGIYGMSGGFKAKGGVIKEKKMAKGGMAYATGGDIKMLSTKQLQELLNNPNLTPMEVEMIEQQLMLRRRMEMNPQSEEIMQQAGITAIPTGNMVPEEGAMAGGGIVAFSKGDTVKDRSAAYEDMLMEEIKRRQESLSKGDPFTESRAEEAKTRAELENIRKTSPFRALAAAGLGTMAGTSQYGLTNLGLGGIEGLKSYSQAQREQSDLNKLLLQQAGERERSKFARESALLGSQQTTLGQLLGRRSAAETAAAARADTASRNKQLDLTRAQNAYSSLYNNAFDELTKSAKPGGVNYQKYKKDPDALKADARRIALGELSPDLRNLLGFQAPAAQATPAAPAAAPAPSGKTPVRVTTPEQRDKLEKGTQYIDPNGVLRIKS